MPLVLTAGPAVEPVTLAEAKAHLRVDGTAEDTLIASLIVTSRLHVEAALGLALITQSWSYFLDAWPRGPELALPLRPVQSIAAVRSTPPTSPSPSSPADTYLLDGAGAPAAPRAPAARSPGPTPGRIANGIEIAFTAGYGDAAADVPAPIRQAILLLVAHWYEHREPHRHRPPAATRPCRPMVSDLLAPYRRGAPMTLTPPAIGALRERLTLRESPSRTADGGGGATVTWETVAELWAARAPHLRRRAPAPRPAVTGRLTHEVWIRHRAGVVPAMRFTDGARIFEIVAVARGRPPPRPPQVPVRGALAMKITAPTHAAGYRPAAGLPTAQELVASTACSRRAIRALTARLQADLERELQAYRRRRAADPEARRDALERAVRRSGARAVTRPRPLGERARHELASRMRLANCDVRAKSSGELVGAIPLTLSPPSGSPSTSLTVSVALSRLGTTKPALPPT